MPVQPVHPPMAAQENEILATARQISASKQLDNKVTRMSARVNKGKPPDFFHYSEEYENDIFPVLEAQLAQQHYYANQYGLIAARSTVAHTIQEAMNSPQREQWLAAMQAELDQLAARKTYYLESPPEGVKIIPTMWVYAL
jgi:hypothetical protein